MPRTREAFVCAQMKKARNLDSNARLCLAELLVYGGQLTMSDPASPARAPMATLPASPNLFAAQVNLAAVILAIILTFAGVKVTQLLPDKLYFSFSKVVDKSSTSPFLINVPPHISQDNVCNIIKTHPEVSHLKCTAEEEAAPQETDEAKIAAEESAKERERKILETLVAKAAQSDGFFYSIMGYLIRLAAPLVAGFIIGRVFGLEGALAASTGAAAAALLLCWPVIVLWSRVVTGDFYEHYYEFITLYVLNMISFFYVARIGCLLGAQMKSKGPVLSLNFGKIVEAVIIATASGVGSKVLEKYIV
jgi:hypothetical protein